MATTGTLEKLEINISYLLFTKQDTISAEKVVVVGILNYEQTKDVPYDIHTVGINEKKVAQEQTTESYLQDQFFYKCVSINNPDKVFLVWDDIIDEKRTTQLNSIYKFELTLDINNELDMALVDLKNLILMFISDIGNNTPVKPTLTQMTIVGQNNYKLLFEEYKLKFEEAKSVINKMASLKQIETLIEMLASGQIVSNMNKISEKQDEILSSISTISDMIS